MEVGEFYRYLLFHDHKNPPAQNRSPDRANTADHRHQQNGDAGGKSEYIAGIEESGASRIDAASDAGKARGDSVDPQLGSVWIYAEIGSGILILFNGAQGQPEFAVGN